MTVVPLSYGLPHNKIPDNNCLGFFKMHLKIDLIYMPFLCITHWIRQLLANQTRVSVLDTHTPLKGCPPSVCHCHLLSFQPWASNSGPQVVSDLFVFPGIYHNSYHNHLKSLLLALDSQQQSAWPHKLVQREAPSSAQPSDGIFGERLPEYKSFYLGH